MLTIRACSEWYPSQTTVTSCMHLGHSTVKFTTSIARNSNTAAHVPQEVKTIMCYTWPAVSWTHGYLAIASHYSSRLLVHQITEQPYAGLVLMLLLTTHASGYHRTTEPCYIKISCRVAPSVTIPTFLIHVLFCLTIPVSFSTLMLTPNKLLSTALCSYFQLKQELHWLQRSFSYIRCFEDEIQFAITKVS